MGRSCPDSVCTVSPAVAHGTAVPSPNCYHLCTSWWFLQIQPRLSSCLLCLCLSYFHTSYLSYHYFFLTFHSLLLLSHFSRVRLCATPETEAHQAPPSLGSSRQEHWSGLPFPSPMNESEVIQSCLTPSEPMDCNLPSSSVHGICQSTGVGCYCLLYHQLPACSNSCPSSWWYHPTISSSVIPFSSHLQSFPASGSFPMSQFFTSGGQNTGVSASAPVLPMNIQGWFPLGLTG